MKYLAIIAVIFLVLFSCEKEVKIEVNSMQELKVAKAKLETAKDSIISLILTLDEKLSKLDTLKRVQEVTILKVVNSDFEHFISLQGNTKTDKNVLVRPKSSGIITAVYVKEGQFVSKGETLLKLDDAIIQNSMNEVKNQLILATTTFKRQERLWNQKIGSEMQFLQAKNNKESLEHKIKTIQSQINNYRVVAPFSGVVDEVVAHIGDMVSPQSPIIRIVNLKDIYIQSEVSENYLSSVKKGAKVKIYFASINKEIESKITQVGNFISPNNRTFKIKIPIQNKNGLIKPNLLADIKVLDFKADKAIVIPSNLIQIDENGKKYVFTIEEKDGVKNVTKKTVKTGKSFDNKTLIINGISLTDIVINEGSRSVSNGQEVKIVE